jgi:small GTP-binding protein
MSLEKIEELQKELSKTKYNKKTQHHIGLIKAKIAVLNEKVSSTGGGKGEGYTVRRTGDATVVMVGFPSVGKSSLLNLLTNADSEIGHYKFTTLTVIPGMLNYKHAKIQILDVPGIIEGAASGKGKGKEILSVMRNADLLLFLIDANKPKQYGLILREVRKAGLRPNEKKPDVKIVKTSKNGIRISTTVKLELTEETVKDVLKTFRFNNADVLIRSKIDIDQFIDCIEANKKYLPGIIVANKIDTCKNLEKLNKIKPDIKTSALKKKNIEKLKELIFKSLNFIRVYMKEPTKAADLEEPLIMREGDSVRRVCEKLHKDFIKNFKFCKVSGPSSKFANQKLGLMHILKDEDVLELHMK